MVGELRGPGPGSEHEPVPALSQGQVQAKAAILKNSRLVTCCFDWWIFLYAWYACANSAAKFSNLVGASATGLFAK